MKWLRRRAAERAEMLALLRLIAANTTPLPAVQTITVSGMSFDDNSERLREQKRRDDLRRALQGVR